MDSSIADLGYEIIGAGGESIAESTTSSYDNQFGDDVQSLADTDAGTGTDADTNDVDTDSSDEEEEPAMNNNNPPNFTTEDHTHEEDETEVDMESMADQSLEHPTELFTPASSHVPQRPPHILRLDHDDPVFLAAVGRLSGRHFTRSEVHSEQTSEAGSKPSPNSSEKTGSGKWPSPQILYKQVVDRYKEDYVLREWCRRIMFATITLLLTFPVVRYLSSSSASQNKVLSTVPVASVASISASKASEILVSTSTSTLTSTLTSTATVNALQTTSASKSLTFIPFAKEKASDLDLSLNRPPLSVKIHSRHDILVKMPRLYKTTWLAKNAILISVSRGPNDIEARDVKISSVPEGLLVELPQEEAYGVLDVTIATTRKPYVNETFHVNFGNPLIVNAFSAGKELMKGFAQTFVDTVNGTTVWVEETCIPAIDLVSKQVGQTPDSVMRSFRDAGYAALDIPTQFMAQVKQSFNKVHVKERVSQAEVELIRQAQDLRDELGLYLLKGQLHSYLLWLKLQGKTEEYERYMAASKPYFEKQQKKALQARQVRADVAKKDIRARRKQERREHREARRSFWRGFGEGL